MPTLKFDKVIFHALFCGRCGNNRKMSSLTHVMDWIHEHCSWNWSQLNWLCWWRVNIGSVDLELVTPGSLIQEYYLRQCFCVFHSMWFYEGSLMSWLWLKWLLRNHHSGYETLYQLTKVFAPKYTDLLDTGLMSCWYYLIVITMQKQFNIDEMFSGIFWRSCVLDYLHSPNYIIRYMGLCFGLPNFHVDGCENREYEEVAIV